LKIEEHAIIDFYLKPNEEAEILKCFLSVNEQLLFHCWEEFLLPESEVDWNRKEYIINRTKIKSRTNPFEKNFCINREVSYWYEPMNKDELINEISKDYYDYVCIIIEKGKETTEYKYLLSIEENFHYEEADDCRALIVKEGRNGDFKNKVLPKIKRALKCI
jgi:hypothetical protein